MIFFMEIEQKCLQIVWMKTKDPEQSKQSWERKMELEESGFLTSAYTTKIQQLRHYGTGTKTEIETNGIR